MIHVFSLFVIGKGKGTHLYSTNGELKLPILKFEINEFCSNKLHVVDFVKILNILRSVGSGFYILNSITWKINFTSTED